MMLADPPNMDSPTDRCVDKKTRAILSTPCLSKLDSSVPERDSHKLHLETGTLYIGDSDHRTRLIKRIGGGSFGEIYLGLRLDTNAQVAVKAEAQDCVVPFLLKEGSVYRKLEGGAGIPRVYWFGLHGSDHAVMIMDLLGSNLYELWTACGSRFSIKTVLMLADQMLDALEHVHRHGYVHRDISVSNFMSGIGEKRSQIYLIDFGHALKMSNSGVFIPAAAKRRVVLAQQPMVGTPRFASVFRHLGHEAGYRDDLESLAYIWVYLLKGRLPWQGQILGPGEAKLARIAQLKASTHVEALCDGLPAEFPLYLQRVRGLRPSDLPDHQGLRELFRGLAGALGVEYDWKFDWMEGGKESTASVL